MSISGTTRNLLAVCALIALSVLATGSALAGTTYYISTDGSDSNSGSISAPFRNIQKGVDMAAAGDTVLVRDGVYTDTDYDGEIVNIIRKNGTASNWITIKAENQYGAILDGQLEHYTHVTNWASHSGSVYKALVNHQVNYMAFASSSADAYAGQWSGVRKSSIAGLSVQSDFFYEENTQTLYLKDSGILSRYINASEGANFAIAIALSSFIKIEGFDLKRSKDGAFNIESGSNIYINRNRIHDHGRVLLSGPGRGLGHGTGIHTKDVTADVTIDSNIFFDLGRLPGGDAVLDYNHDHGLYLIGDAVRIVNNLFYGIKAGYPVQLAGYTDPETNPLGIMGADISNNTFYGKNPQRDGHITTIGAVHDLVIENNISHTPGVYFIENVRDYAYAGNNSTNSPPRNIVRNNLVYSSTSVRIANYITEALYTTFTDNTVGSTAALDPLFVNLGVYNFHLQAASPAINKGNAVGLTADIEGKPYIGLPDLGAYEYQGAGTPPAAPDSLRVR